MIPIAPKCLPETRVTRHLVPAKVWRLRYSHLTNVPHTRTMNTAPWTP